MNSNKKFAEITGRLIYPLTLGMPAYIRETDGVRKTTPIVSVKSMTDSMARFETRNTDYLMYFDGGIKYDRV